MHDRKIADERWCRLKKLPQELMNQLAGELAHPK